MVAEAEEVSTALEGVCQAEDDREVLHKDSLEASPFNDPIPRMSTTRISARMMALLQTISTRVTILPITSLMPIFDGYEKWAWASCLLLSSFPSTF